MKFSSNRRRSAFSLCSGRYAPAWRAECGATLRIAAKSVLHGRARPGRPGGLLFPPHAAPSCVGSGRSRAWSRLPPPPRCTPVCIPCADPRWRRTSALGCWPCASLGEETGSDRSCTGGAQAHRRRSGKTAGSCQKKTKSSPTSAQARPLPPWCACPTDRGARAHSCCHWNPGSGSSSGHWRRLPTSCHPPKPCRPKPISWCALNPKKRNVTVCQHLPAPNGGKFRAPPYFGSSYRNAGPAPLPPAVVRTGG